MRRVIEVMRTLAGVLCVALLMCGCATSHPLIVDPSQAYNFGFDEGIVFGSVRVEIAPGVNVSRASNTASSGVCAGPWTGLSIW